MTVLERKEETCKCGYKPEGQMAQMARVWGGFTCLKCHKGIVWETTVEHKEG